MVTEQDIHKVLGAMASGGMIPIDLKLTANYVQVQYPDGNEGPGVRLDAQLSDPDDELAPLSMSYLLYNNENLDLKRFSSFVMGYVNGILGAAEAADIHMRYADQAAPRVH